MRAHEFLEENASVGATGSGAVATVAQSLGHLQRRQSQHPAHLLAAQPAIAAKYMNSLYPVKRKKRSRN